MIIFAQNSSVTNWNQTLCTLYTRSGKGVNLKVANNKRHFQHKPCWSGVSLCACVQRDQHLIYITIERMQIRLYNPG